MNTVNFYFRKLIRPVRVRLTFLLDSLLILLPRPNKSETTKQVLIIRFDAIGDFVLWLDAAKRLRDLYPQSRITLLGNEAWVSLAKQLPYFDEVWELNRQQFINNIKYRHGILKRIRREGFDVIIQPTFSREFYYGDAIVRISGAKKRIGSQGDYSNISSRQKRISDHWYTELIFATAEPLMELKRNAEFMRGLGLTDFKAGIPELDILGHQSDLNNKDYYVLFPGAGVGYRKWPLSNFADLASRIYHATGWVGIICGSPDEASLGAYLIHEANVPLQNLVGQTSLQELATIIGKANLVVGNETSAVHIAAAVATPSVCILGGGHFGRFAPYRLEEETQKPVPLCVFNKMKCFGCNWKCIYATAKDQPFPCVAGVSVEAAWIKVEEVIKAKRV